MDEDKRKKRNKKKKNKCNNVTGEKAEGAPAEEIRGSQLTNDKINLDEKVQSSLVELETNDFLKNEDKMGCAAAESEERLQSVSELKDALEREVGRLQSISELKDALEREVGHSQSLRAQRALLEEQLAQFAVNQASKEDEIIKLKDENRVQKQKEASIVEEVRQLKEEKYAWLQKEAITEEEIKKVKDENHLLHQKEACKDEEIRRLKDEKHFLLQKEASTEDEIKKLRFENFHLQKEIEELKESLEKLSQERRQLSSKLVAVQTGMQQLEREARIRAQVEQDIASTGTQGVSKRWLAWGSAKDPVAEAVGIAEESCMQKEAAAAIVEKLVTENAELMEKVNELHMTVDQLTQKCNNHTESSGPNTNAEEDGTMLSESAFKAKSTYPKLSNILSVTNQPSTSPTNHNTSYIESETETARVSKDPATTAHVQNGLSVPGSAVVIQEAQQISIVSIDPVTSSYAQNGLSVPNSAGAIEEAKQSNMVITDPATTRHIHSGLSVPESAAAMEEANQSTSDAVREHAVLINHNNSKEPVPLSDAPLLGAPIRIFSFLTRFVSGADLVEPKN